MPGSENPVPFPMICAIIEYTDNGRLQTQVNGHMNKG